MSVTFAVKPLFFASSSTTRVKEPVLLTEDFPLILKLPPVAYPVTSFSISSFLFKSESLIIDSLIIRESIYYNSSLL
jgi:hypothetical protein